MLTAWLGHGLAAALGVGGWLALRQTILLRRAARWRPLMRPPAVFETRPLRPKARVLVIGDSTGVGVGLASSALSLPGLLAVEYDRLEVVNRCRSGARIGDISKQVRSFVGCGRQFDLVLVLAGGNDVLRMTRSRVLDVASRRLLRRLSGIAEHVVWMGCADVGTAPALLPPVSWWLSHRTRRVSATIARAVNAQGADFIDFSARRHSARFAAASTLYFAEDGLHPAGAAYRYCFDCLKKRLHRLGVPTDEWRTRNRSAAAAFAG